MKGMVPELLSYGPNTVLVHRFFARLESLPIREWLEAIGNVRLVSQAEWDRADAAAHLIIEQRGIGGANDRATFHAARLCELPLILLEQHPATSHVSAQEVRTVVSSGATALLLRGIAPPEVVRTLYAPWADIVPLHEIDS